MKRLLSKSEYLPYAPEHTGIVRINHKSDYCVGDSLSLLVERKEDGSVAAHCFRCGSGGYSGPRLRYRDAASLREAAAKRNEDRQVVVGGIELPNDTTGLYDDFAPAARAWLSKAGLTKQRIEHENFLWSSDEQCLYIPVRQAGELRGYVQRYFREDAKRYRTLQLDKALFFGYYPVSGEVDKPSENVVVVEDTLSGLRVSENYDTLVALGTNLSPAAVSLLLRQGYKRAVIFLDADNAVVRREARRMAKKLPFLRVTFVETGRDPKSYTEEQLKQLIDFALVV